MFHSFRHFIKHSPLNRYFNNGKFFSSKLRFPDGRRGQGWIRRQQMRLLDGISLPLSSALHYSSHCCFDSSHGEVPSLLSCSLSHSFVFVSQEKLLISSWVDMGRSLVNSSKCGQLGLGSKIEALCYGVSKEGERGREIDFEGMGRSGRLIDCQNESPKVVFDRFGQAPESGLRRKMSTLSVRASNEGMGRSRLSFNHQCLSRHGGFVRFGDPCLVCHSNWSLELVLGRKMSTLSSMGLNYRSFCKVSDIDSETEGQKEETEGQKEENEDDGGDNSGENEGFESKADPKEVERVCKVIDELFASDRNMEGVLDQCGIELSHDLVLDVLARFEHAYRPAFRFFSWAGEKPEFEHDSRTYNAMMRLLGKGRQFESMVGMLEEMGKKGLLTIEAFSIAIRAFVAQREMKKAMGIFELMKRHNFKANVDTYNCLLDALGRAKLGKEAQALFEKLKDRFTPDLRTYSVLLAGWCKLKNLVEAGRVWNEMVDKGILPDIITHNIMLEGLLKGRRNSEAVKLFELMKAKGPSPSVRSYTILIRDLCSANKMDLAVEYFNEMVGVGINPDPAVYTCLMVGFGNQKQMYKVYGLLKEMTEKGCPPDGRTYNALIKMMTNREMPDNAVRLYKKMIQSGFKPTIHTYNMMMKSYFHLKNYDMGHATWDEMISKGCCPDDNSYTVFIGGLIKNGRPEEACKYIEEMIEKGMKAPQLDYNKFAADYCRAGTPDILEKLAQKMKFSGKFEHSNAFARWSDMMKNRINRRDPGKGRHQFG